MRHTLCCMRAGRLDRTITIRSITETPDGFGGITRTETVLGTVPAEKTDLTGREYFAAAQVNAEITTRFTIRYGLTVTPLHRITCDGRDYDILHVAEIGRREGLQIMAKARV